MAYIEHTSEIGTVISLSCDKKNCDERTAAHGETREESNHTLYLRGWRLYRGKQLCPKHARQIAKKLARAASGKGEGEK